MFYAENCRTRGVSVNNKEKRASSISDFLIAYKHFYEIVLKLKYPMPILTTEDLSAEIKVRLENKGYIILESEPFPAMQREEYEFTCKFFNSQYPLHGKQLQVWIILQLSFLYGLSFSTIRNLRTNNIDLETRTIKVLTKSKDKTIILELPYNIFKNIELHITNNNLQNDNLLFLHVPLKVFKNKLPLFQALSSLNVLIHLKNNIHYNNSMMNMLQIDLHIMVLSNMP